MEIVNEMGVIVDFVQRAPQYGIEIVSIRAEFPDTVIRVNGQDYRAEFEFKSKNFIAHRHDPRNCDLIICWINDIDEFSLSVWELSQPDWFKPVELPSDKDREILYWQYRARVAEARLRRLRGEIRAKSGIVECENCGRSDFGTIQALNAHRRFCEGIGIGQNGKN